MTDEQEDSPTVSRPTVTLRPRHKESNPNPHSDRNISGRSLPPTPNVVMGRLCSGLGIQESHRLLIVLFVLLVSVFFWAISTQTISVGWLVPFGVSVLGAYGIYYTVPPRKAAPVVSRLEDLYNIHTYAKLMTSIVGITIISTLALIGLLVATFHLNAELIAPTSVMISVSATIVGVLSSYVLFRVLASKVYPNTSTDSLIEKIVSQSSIVEALFVLSALGAPVYVIVVVFFWNRPELFSLPFAVTYDSASITLLGLITLYTALVSRV